MMRADRMVRDERGMTFTELMVAVFVGAIVIAILGTWFAAVNRVELAQDDDFDAISELRDAKSEMTKELRFAAGVVSVPTNGIEVWIDHDRSGGGGPDQPGERVTWQIVGDELLRYEDGNPAVARSVARLLVGTSSSIVVSGAVVDIVLVADDDTTATPNARTIQTQVTLRNA